jgi:hypothetical protein
MSERWRPVPGFDRYEVSDQGRVRSLDHVTHDGQRRRGRVLRAGITAGYGRVILTRTPARKKNALVHRLVLEAFVGPAPPGTQACHENGNPIDCRLENLRWGTPKSNHEDKAAHGTAPKGEKNPSAKLSRDDVERMREQRLFGATYADLGRQHGVTTSAARFAVLGRTWA